MPPTTVSNAIVEHDLESYALELENDGLTVVPPEIVGMPADVIDRCIEVLLAKFTEVTGGCSINLEEGPTGAFEWELDSGKFMAGDDSPPPTQATVVQLLKMDRYFRDLVVNPVADALIDHLIGPTDPPPGLAGAKKERARRLSSSTGLYKWQGEFGYGDDLGLHVDQAYMVKPWGRTATKANATFLLTDYTKEGGALAYIPGSHKLVSDPDAESAPRALPVEAPKGSFVIWHGATWHGAFPRLIPGLRLAVVNYYCHVTTLPQELLSVSMMDEPWDDCDNPELMSELLWMKDSTPYVDGKLYESYPRVVG